MSCTEGYKMEGLSDRRKLNSSPKETAKKRERDYATQSCNCTNKKLTCDGDAKSKQKRKTSPEHELAYPLKKIWK